MEEKIIEFRIHVPRIHLSPRTWKWGLASLLILALAENPATESVTLSTYYPAPAGAYNNMVTIGNTWLARDPTSMGAMSFVELGGNTFSNPNNDVKLDVENGSVRLTAANDGSLSDHWIGADGVSGANLALYGKSGGGVDIGIGSNPAMTIIGNTINTNQEIGFNYPISFGPYTTNPNAGSMYLHVNATTGCQLWGPGAGTCNGAQRGAEGCSCPAGSYATWAPGIYSEGSGYPSQYEWGVDPLTSGGTPFFAPAGSYSQPISVNVKFSNGLVASGQVAVPGANYDALDNPTSIVPAYGSEFFYCCPK